MISVWTAIAIAVPIEIAMLLLGIWVAGHYSDIERRMSEKRLEAENVAWEQRYYQCFEDMKGHIAAEKEINAELEAEVERLRRADESVVGDMAEMESRVERLQGLVRELIDVNSVWQQFGHLDPITCFWCGHHKPNHYDDCPYIVARAALEQKP